MALNAQRRVARIRSPAVSRSVAVSGRDRTKHGIMIEDPVADDVDDLAFLLEPSADVLVTLIR